MNVTVVTSHVACIPSCLDDCWDKSAQQSCVQSASCVYQVKTTSVTRQFNHNHNIKIQRAQVRLKYICKCPLRSKVIALLRSPIMPNKNASLIEM